MSDINLERLRTQAENGNGCEVSQSLNKIASMEDRLQILKEISEQSQKVAGLHQLHFTEAPEGAGVDAALKVQLSRDVSPASPDASSVEKFLSKYVWANATESLYSEKHYYLTPAKDKTSCADRH